MCFNNEQTHICNLKKYGDVEAYMSNFKEEHFP